MRQMLNELREEEVSAHGKIEAAFAAMDSTPTTPGFSERLRRLEAMADRLQRSIAELEAARAKDLAEQAALGRRVHFTIVALLLAVAGIVAPSIIKALQQ